MSRTTENNFGGIVEEHPSRAVAEQISYPVLGRVIDPLLNPDFGALRVVCGIFDWVLVLLFDWMLVLLFDFQIRDIEVDWYFRSKLLGRLGVCKHKLSTGDCLELSEVRRGGWTSQCGRRHQFWDIFRKEWVTQDLVNRRAFAGICDEHPRYKSLRGRRDGDILRKRVGIHSYPSVSGLHIRGFKGWLADDKRVHDHPKGPNVDFI